MKLDHTPGPWEWNGVTCVSAPDGDCLTAQTPFREGGLREAKATARLIAAAPEMLDWLIDDIRRSENTWIEMWCENPDNDLDATEDEIRAACRSHEINAKQIALIEKATGKTWEELNA